MEFVARLIIDESKWFSFSMLVAAAGVALMWLWPTRANRVGADRATPALNLFFALVVGTMAGGHLMAVTTKMLLGTLSAPAPRLYLIGIALALPSVSLATHVRRILRNPDTHQRRTMVLNGWVVATLVLLGPANLPLAVPGLLNVAYVHSPARRLRTVIASVAILTNAALFLGGLIFL